MLRDHTLEFDPHASKNRVNQMIPARLRCRIISGHFLSSACTDQTDLLTATVTVSVTDLDKKVAYSTRAATEHILYTKFSMEQMTFSKLMLSEMCFVHITVERKVGMDMVPFAYRILPLDYINNGEIFWMEFLKSIEFRLSLRNTPQPGKSKSRASVYFCPFWGDPRHAISSYAKSWPSRSICAG